MSNTYFSDAVMISNFYTFALYDKVKEYMVEHNVSQDSLMNYYHWMIDELKAANDYQEEHQETIDKNVVGYEHVMSKTFIEEAMRLTEEDISGDAKLALQSLKSSAIAAYKYQLKFCIFAFKNIILDERFWNGSMIH